MATVVYKLPLPEPNKYSRYHLRRGFLSLHVANQYNQPTLWFQVEQDETVTLEVQFICVGTGWPLPSNDYWHVGTLVTETGFVWHYYAKYVNEQ